MDKIETQVGIVGGGPAGLMLSQLLSHHGIDSILLEMHSRRHCEERIRAGVLEQGSVDMLREAGVGGRLDREGMRHEGIEIGFDRLRHRIPLTELTNGKAVTVYGQHEVVKDLIAKRLEDGGDIRFECHNVRVNDLTTGKPSIQFEEGGREKKLECDYISGCDGFHGVCRPAIPADSRVEYDRSYPFGWLGILAEAAPTLDELVYMQHERGFALYSMRSPSVTRLYLQCKPDEDVDRWTDDQIWSELFTRLECYDGWKPKEGKVLQKGVTGMRSHVTEPMQYGNLFLAGDAAHIVPPTGAKGMNLALADVYVLARALRSRYHENSTALLRTYSEICLRRVWKAQRFSWWMTSLLHRFDEDNAFDRRRRRADLDYVTSSRAAATALAENYTGLPLELDSVQ